MIFEKVSSFERYLVRYKKKLGRHFSNKTKEFPQFTGPNSTYSTSWVGFQFCIEHKRKNSIIIVILFIYGDLHLITFTAKVEIFSSKRVKKQHLHFVFINYKS